MGLKLICIVIGYFIGSIQSAFIVGKLMKVDLRNHGSGNLGSTNALRVLGKKAGLITFVSDIMKSVLSYVICRLIFGDTIGAIAGIYGCVGAVLGHNFPFYLNFKGGKGIAVMIGMMLCLSTLDYRVTLITFGIGILGLFTRYVSIGSMAFSIAIPISLYILKFDMEYVIICAILGVLAIYKHKANIKRLIDGNENKLGAKKQAVHQK
ncbi:MAG: glycerol-3-phosphate 1-O-acyltransferase PlsY [Tyzzerella sp.]|uniref:Glycerol-3-phosphate acyltransferase n=1 Tax=Candidatus Fimicola merdigallinarum TaxID=2840819 RepID=A0A9D9DUA3_9FIRM|nr:glycerol-3-phosphate 1-O-acyltransferase PlsY [Candidatus Fimicola merdigallinarum]